jgi:hypothetical protein
MSSGVEWSKRAGIFALSLAVATSALAPSADARPAGRWRTRSMQLAQNSAKSAGTQTGKLLTKAQDLFDDQQYEESIQTLSGALVRPDVASADKTEILKLLAFNYITLGRTDEADATVRALLVHDEAYALPKSESPRFRTFFDKTRSTWESEGKPGRATEAQPAEKKPIAIKHSPIAQVAPGDAVKVEGTIDDADARVARCELFYRSGSEGKFVQKPLVYSMGAFRGQIPGSVATPPLLEYFVLALDGDGLPVASRGDTDAPLRVAVPAPEDDSVFVSPWFWIPVGAAVAGGIVLTAVLASQSSSGGGGGGGGGGGNSDSTVNISIRE